MQASRPKALCALAGALVAGIGLVAGPARAETKDAAPPAGARTQGPIRSRVPKPLALAGERMLADGEILLGYRYEFDRRNGNRTGTSRRTEQQVRADGYSEVPTNLDVESHFFSVLWAPHARVTLSAEVPYVRTKMNQRAADGRNFVTRSSGVGDLLLHTRLLFMRNGEDQLVFGAGLSAPTGSTTHSADTPGGNNQRLPYPMQLGTGTWDFYPSATYTGQYGWNAWGVRLGGIVRMGDNGDWTEGDEFNATAWWSQEWQPWLFSSLRVGWRDRERHSGRDNRLDETLRPDNGPRRQGGAVLDLGPGITVGTEDVRLAVEATWPLYRSLRGPQLESDWALRAGWQWAF